MLSQPKSPKVFIQIKYENGWYIVYVNGYAKSYWRDFDIAKMMAEKFIPSDTRDDEQLIKAILKNC